MSNSSVRLSACELSFTYGSARFALEGVSFEVGAGELVGLLGHNGSGKSTIIKLIMRLLKPQGGQIMVEGRRAGSWPLREYARRVAYVPQESAAIFAFTALESVLMGRSPHTGALGFESAEDLEIARRALERVDVAGLADELLEELSGGERQRVILARALAQQANLLVLDEPAAFLDIRHQYDLYKLLAELAHDENRSCLCASHDLNVAAAFCDRLLLMHGGKLLATGSPEEVLTPEVIAEAYGIRVEVHNGPGGRPIIIPQV